MITFANEEYKRRVNLSINPNPDSVLRVFMVYKPITSTIDITPQELTTFTRTGFNVVEWGGTEVDRFQIETPHVSSLYFLDSNYHQKVRA